MKHKKFSLILTMLLTVALMTSFFVITVSASETVSTHTTKADAEALVSHEGAIGKFLLEYYTAMGEGREAIIDKDLFSTNNLYEYVLAKHDVETVYFEKDQHPNDTVTVTLGNMSMYKIKNGLLYIKVGVRTEMVQLSAEYPAVIG